MSSEWEINEDVSVFQHGGMNLNKNREQKLFRVSENLLNKWNPFINVMACDPFSH